MLGTVIILIHFSFIVHLRTTGGATEDVVAEEKVSTAGTGHAWAMASLLPKASRSI